MFLISLSKIDLLILRKVFITYDIGMCLLEILQSFVSQCCAIVFSPILSKLNIMKVCAYFKFGAKLYYLASM